MVDLAYPPGEEAWKGASVLCVICYMSWVHNAVRQLVLYLLKKRRIRIDYLSTRGLGNIDQWFIRRLHLLKIIPGKHLKEETEFDIISTNVNKI